MSFERVYNFDLAQHSTLRIGGTGKVLYSITSESHELEKDLKNIFEEIAEQKLPWMMLGEGSNSVFADGFHEMAFVQLKASSPSRSFSGARPPTLFQCIQEESEYVLLKISGTMSWDALVSKTVEMGFGGLEALSAIPGTVGAAPVQNIGAYGAQFSDVCESVEVFDTRDQQIKVLPKEDCHFEYRSSIFKHSKQYIITSVTLHLSRNTNHPPLPAYKEVQDYFEKQGIATPSLSEIREAITTIRWSKLPTPLALPNCGSFFKNSEISSEHAEKLLKEYPAMPVFENKKTSAGWLIEQVGLKGYRIGGMGIYDKHALVIVNHGGGTFIELERLIKLIQKKVHEKFGILVEAEVNVVASTSSATVEPGSMTLFLSPKSGNQT